MSEVWSVINDDAAVALTLYADASFDSMVTDPPSGIGFMNKEWDSDKGGRLSWIAWLQSIMVEALRVLKPGSHALVWAIPRTSHWTATALENAGFEIRDVVTHHFGTGFPKSLNISKAIDAHVLTGKSDSKHTASGEQRDRTGLHWSELPKAKRTHAHQQTEPETAQGKRWEGYGTALKPATEHWILARKPLSGTVAVNVQEHGTGGLNIDACRIKGRERVDYGLKNAQRTLGVTYSKPSTAASFDSSKGRWPANLVLSHLLECTSGSCVDGCSVTSLGEVSRFFYVAKPSTAERDEGLSHLPKKKAAEITDREDGSAGINNPRAGSGRTSEGRANYHPTVKSIELMSYLVRLITPVGGCVLDPFCGSGSIGVAAVKQGFAFVGIEKESEFVTIAEARIRHHLPHVFGLVRRGQ